MSSEPLGWHGRGYLPHYFDRFIRDEADLQRTISYVENNPVSAGLVSEPQEWRFSSAWGKGRA